ncbi:hypothetical protein CIB48_g12127, partial [Xylaria polymorpha]
DGTIIRGVQGATFAGFIPPGRRTRLGRAPPEPGPSEPGPSKPTPLKPTSSNPNESSAMDEDSNADCEYDIDEDMGFEYARLDISPTPEDAVYFDDKGNPIDEQVNRPTSSQDAGNAGKVTSWELSVPEDFKKQIAERAISMMTNIAMISIEDVDAGIPWTTEIPRKFFYSSPGSTTADVADVEIPWTTDPENPWTTDPETPWNTDPETPWNTDPETPWNTDPEIPWTADAEIPSADADIPWTTEVPLKFVYSSPDSATAGVGAGVPTATETPHSRFYTSPASSTVDVNAEIPWVTPASRRFSLESSSESSLSCDYRHMEGVESSESGASAAAGVPAKADNVADVEAGPRPGLKRSYSAGSIERDVPPKKKPDNWTGESKETRQG